MGMKDHETAFLRDTGEPGISRIYEFLLHGPSVSWRHAWQNSSVYVKKCSTEVVAQSDLNIANAAVRCVLSLPNFRLKIIDASLLIAYIWLS